MCALPFTPKLSIYYSICINLLIVNTKVDHGEGGVDDTPWIFAQPLTLYPPLFFCILLTQLSIYPEATHVCDLIYPNQRTATAPSVWFSSVPTTTTDVYVYVVGVRL